MNQMLQQRIQNLMGDAPMPPMGMQAGGEVDAMPEMITPNPDAELASAAINEFMMAADTAESAEEANIAKALAEKTATAAQAPMADMAAELAAQGRGGDSVLAHLTPGEVVLPAEMFDDPQFEATVESRFNELDLDPERYVVGMGIASLNANTGLEEFFLKKVGKFFKKVVKKIAPVAGPLANFIPGVGPLVAAGIGAATNLAAGKGLKGAITGGLSGYGAGKLLGGIGSLGSVGGEAVSGLKGGFADLGFFDKFKALGSGVKSGIGSLLGGGTEKVGLSALTPSEVANLTPDQLKALKQQDMLMQLQKSGVTGDKFSEIAETLGIKNPSDPESIGKVFAQAQQLGLTGAPSSGGSFFSKLISGGGADDKGQFGLVGDIFGGGLGGKDGRIGLGGTLAAGGIAALLGKLAFDEAKNRKGVPLTPLTQMDAAGRYNIEAEIARRMGKEKPSPVEFGLLPAGTLPQLSGGRPTPRFKALPAGPGPGLPLRRVRPYSDRESAGEMNPVPAVMMNGGMVAPMRYAEGGNVAMEDFERMNGDINGPGTETSDDVPAMLSDGEFVMTGRAVRGAGAFDMSKGEGGIITLTPNKEEDRDRGTALMYDMMDLFSDFAGART